MRPEPATTGGLLAENLAQTAAGHRILAATAESPAEAEHWTAEAERFEHLALLAETQLEVARRAYRPTRSYEPETDHSPNP